jgi:peroxin-13
MSRYGGGYGYGGYGGGYGVGGMGGPGEVSPSCHLAPSGTST